MSIRLRARFAPTLPPPRRSTYIRLASTSVTAGISHARDCLDERRRSPSRSGRPCGGRAWRRTPRAAGSSTRTTTQPMSKRFWATCATTRFVLSPSVATTTASASLDPCLAKHLRRPSPWPTTKPPFQPSPSRASASSFSSTAVTSQPSAVELLGDGRADAAATDHDCLHGQERSGPSGPSCRPPRARPAGRRRRAPRTARCGARSRPSARRTATAGASAAPSRGRSGRRPRFARLLDDRFADRRGRGRSRRRPRRRFLAERARLVERRGGALLARPSSGASSGSVERHPDHVKRLDRRAALLRELDRGRDHLLADGPSFIGTRIWRSAGSDELGCSSGEHDVPRAAPRRARAGRGT